MPLKLAVAEKCALLLVEKYYNTGADKYTTNTELPEGYSASFINSSGHWLSVVLCREIHTD